MSKFFLFVELSRKKTFFCTLFLTNSIGTSLYNNCEKGDEMYYELYVDSLFLVNFVMNLYLLLLVNQSTYRTATRLRLVLGAMAGAFCYLMPFFCGGPAWLRYLFGAVAGMAAMYFVVFRIRSLHAFLVITGKLLIYSFLMGGCLLFLMRSIPAIKGFLTGIFGVMGAGAVIFLCLFYGKKREEQNKESSLCKVTLVSGGKTVTVTALLDSGNSLVEPISGEPVSVVDGRELQALWDSDSCEKGQGVPCRPRFRVIPYRSIGKKKGILYACLLEEIRIELDGLVKVCKNVYVASSGEEISDKDNSGKESVRMILNPALLNDR